MQIFGERTVDGSREVQDAERKILECVRCGGSGVTPNSILGNKNSLIAKIQNGADGNEIEEREVRLTKKRRARHAKNKKENPDNPSYGLCECRIQAEIVKEIIRGNLPASTIGSRFADIVQRDISVIDQTIVDARKFARFYRRRFSQAKKASIGCNFFGPYGCGKTFLAQFIASQIAKKRYTVHYTPLFLLLETMKKENIVGSTHLYQILDVDMLVIDDIGNEQINRRASCGELAFFLKQRSTRRKVTFYIFNNMKPEDMRETYDSLFCSACNEHNMNVMFKTKIQNIRARNTRIKNFLTKVNG